MAPNPTGAQQPQRQRSDRTSNHAAGAAHASGNAWATAGDARRKDRGGERERERERERDGGRQQGRQQGRELARLEDGRKGDGLEDETHVPVHGFNAGEVKEFMGKVYAEGMKSAGGEKNALHKAEQPRSSQPWGSRPNHMANGQNFWVEFVKQVKLSEEEHARRVKASGDGEGGRGNQAGGKASKK